MLGDDPFDRLRREIDRIQRHFDQIQSPMQQLLDEQRRLAEMVEGPAREWRHILASIADSDSFVAIRRMSAERETLLTQVQIQNVSRELEEVRRTWASAFDRVRDQMEEAARVASEIGRASRLAHQTANFTSISEESLRRIELAGAALHDSLATFEHAETLEERHEVLPSLLHRLIEWIETFPPDAISVQTALKLLPIFMLLASAYDLVSDYKFKATAERQWEEMIEKIDSLAIESEPGSVFRTTHALPLRVAPHAQARRVGTVPADILLEQLDQRGRWLSIVYLDLQSGMPVSGWIYKRGLVVAADTAEDRAPERP